MDIDKSFPKLESEEDRKLLEDIVKKHEKRMLSWARSHLTDKNYAEDCVQDAIIAIIKSFDRIKHIDNENDRILFILIIIKNIAFSYNNKYSNIMIEDFDDIEMEISLDFVPDVCDILITQELIEIVRRYIDSLSPVYRYVLIMRYQLHLRCKEIAKALGVSDATVRKRLERAKRKLKEVGGEKLSAIFR